MGQPIAAVEEIHKKYMKHFKILDDQLEALEIKEKALHSNHRGFINPKEEAFQMCTSLESAKKRNKELLRNLEIIKAKIRSNAAFSPTENVVEAARKNYLENPSLVPVSKKLYGPVYV